MDEKIVAADVLHKGRFTVRKARIRSASGEMNELEMVEAPSGAAVLPYDPDRRVAVLISQARAPVLKEGEPRMFEAIAGALDGDEPEVCAKREAMEEGGLRLGDLEHVASVWASPANSTERVDYFLAPYSASDRVGAGGGLEEEHEHIAVSEIPLGALKTMLDEGTIRDVKVLVLAQALMLRHGDLFP